MAKILLTERDRQTESLRRRMDKFDSVCTEYMRKYRVTTEKLADRIGTTPSTLWRYRNRVESFESASFATVTAALKLANVSNETLRYICGL
jgi:transcriptional regulator with XRE-family HTH domain